MRSGRVRRVVGAIAGVCAGVMLHAAPAGAAAIITNGSGIYLGINNLGHLNVADGTGGVTLTPTNSSAIGLYYAAVDGDATAPGCLCEGFGVSADGVRGYADIASGGINNLTSDSFVATPSTAVAVSHLTAGASLQVTQDYHPSTDPALIEAVVTLTNTGATPFADVRYNRTMDWDIPPTTFDELVTIGGWPAANLLCTGDNGFAIPDPLAACSTITAPSNANFAHNPVGGADHGAMFTFAFGGLAPGESKSFSIFYGAAPSEAAAFAALGAVGAEVYSFGQCTPPAGGTCGPVGTGTPATFIFAFKGVGGTPVPPSTPEPVSMLLMGTGGVAALLRRKFRTL